MSAQEYPVEVRTIEQIRLENFRQLVQELRASLGREPTAVELSDFTGISSVYAWQLQTGKRDAIDSKAARKIDRRASKGDGWMDTDFTLWPFPGISPAKFENLRADQVLEIQGIVRQRIERFEEDANAAKSAKRHCA